MNWFKLKNLEKRLADNRVTEKEGFYFLLANWIVFGFISFVAVDTQHDNPGVMLMLLIVPTIGLFIGFKANQEGDGNDFLKRFIPLHFVIGVRFFVLTLVLTIIGETLASSISNEVIKGWLLGGLIIVMGIVFYYTLAKSVRKVSRSSP